MPDWLTSAATPEAGFSAGLLAIRLGLALAFGVAVALIYRFTHGRNKTDAPMLMATLVLLSLLLAMVTMVIGNSVARAFGLVGALSIVRFRTVVEDTRDTAFVILAVVVGMATGTGMIMIPVVGLPVVALAALGLSRFDRRGVTGATRLLVVRLGLGRDPEKVLGPVIAKHAEGRRLVSIATARQGAALELTFSVRLGSPDAQISLVVELNQTEGVVGVELRES